MFYFKFKKRYFDLINKKNLEKDINTKPIRKKNSLDDEINKKSKSSESIEWITIFSYFKFIFFISINKCFHSFNVKK